MSTSAKILSKIIYGIMVYWLMVFIRNFTQHQQCHLYFLLKKPHNLHKLFCNLEVEEDHHFWVFLFSSYHILENLYLYIKCSFLCTDFFLSKVNQLHANEATVILDHTRVPQRVHSLCKQIPNTNNIVFR